MVSNNNVYDRQYYTEIIARGSAAPYTDAEFWGNYYAVMAKDIVEKLNPRTVLDAGCALGYLVAALRDLGVEAYGVDISEYAIANVREDIRPYCAVGSLLEPLPEVLPRKYDLVLSIEVLEHLTAEDGKTAIRNLCQYSDKILFSSSPEDFEDITHINVQQREYWAEIFAKEKFYDSIFNRPTWITPWSVLYCRNENVEAVIANFERFVRQTDAKAAIPEKQQEFAGKVYFNFGQGESEENSVSYAFTDGAYFRHKLMIPAGCKSIRLDPVEGYGCLIRNLNVRSDSAQLRITHCNGLRLQDLLVFRTIDPQIYFMDVPQDMHWLEVEAEVQLFDSAAWIKLCESAEELVKNNGALSECCDMKEQELCDLQHAVQEQDRQLTESRKVISERDEMLKELEQILADKSAEIAELEAKCTAHWNEIQDYSKLVACEREQLACQREQAEQLSNVLNDVLASISWKITKPLRFAKKAVKKVLRVPVKCLRLMKKVIRTLRQYGLKVTLKKIKNKLTGKQEVIAAPLLPAATPVFAPNNIIRNTVTGNPVDPIQTVLVDEPVKRLNLVTDTINADSLLGGVATALIVASEFANRYDYELRIITRNTETNPLNYENIIRISGIEKPRKVSFYSDYERFNKSIDFKMEISPDDIFFATSWWSAMAIAETTIRKRFFYIIQEVETFFYNYGGERMLCEQVMQNPNIDFIINSGYLNTYFANHDPQIVENGCYFEPAFSQKLYKNKVFKKKDRYKLFFYARPNNPRNLYTVGVEMLKKAVEKGILDTNEWDIYCVGQNAPVITFHNGVRSRNLGQLSWTEYGEFLSDVDLGLCLMYTPHPSYPPFDVASSGGVVLSNKMLNKTSFDMCSNVILADLDEESFMRSFKDAVALAKNMEQRKKNYEENTIPRDWHHTLEETISYMKGKCADV